MNTIFCMVCVSNGITGNSDALKLRGPAHSVTSRLSWCTCAFESASAQSQYQQAVFHRSVTEAQIRAESTQNNHTELRDNPEPKHQRKWKDTASSIIQQESALKTNTRDEMRRYCPTPLAQEKQDVMNLYAWSNWKTSVPSPWDPGCYGSKQWLRLYIFTEKSSLLCLLLHSEADECIKSWQLYRRDDHRNEALNSLQASAEKAGLVWTVHHYAPFTPQVSDVVSYGATYFTGWQRLLLKGVTQCCYMCYTAVWDTKYSRIILNLSFNPAAPTAPHPRSCALSI